jgi:hypothetical protein
MAIFASTTTSGYSDPLRALTIKALEKRQADLLAQQAQQQMPETIATPIQGFGYLANQIGDQMRSGRADAALAAKRDELARVQAGIGPEGPNPQQLAQVGAADPGLRDLYLKQIADARAAAAAHAQETSMQTGRQKFEGEQKGLDRGETQATRKQSAEQFTATQDLTKSESALTRQSARDLATQSQRANADLAQAERDTKVAENALDRASKSGDQQAMIAAQSNLEEAKAKHGLARDAANNLATASEGEKTRTATAALPASPEGKIKADEAKGFLTPEERVTALKPEIKPAVITGATAAKETYTQHKLSLEKLDQAKELLDKGIYTGRMQDVKTIGSQITPFGDKEKADRTSTYNSLVDEKAIDTMSKTLKGQSTDFEMKEFKKIFNNPNSSDADRYRAMDRLIRAARSDLTTHAEAVKAYGGDTKRIDEELASIKGGGGPKAAAPTMTPDEVNTSLDNARAAISAGKDPQFIKEQLRKNGIDPKGL